MNAQYSQLPHFSGDGYGFGGGAAVTFDTDEGSLTVLFGEGVLAHKIAKRVTEILSAEAPNPKYKEQSRCP